jgi:hypothetical protein
VKEEDETEGRSTHLTNLSHASSREEDHALHMLPTPPRSPRALSPADSPEPLHGDADSKKGDPSTVAGAAGERSSDASTREHEDTQATIGPVVAHTLLSRTDASFAADCAGTATAASSSDGAWPAPPTTENVAQHTRALERSTATQRGRFTFKKTMTEMIHSENSSFADRMPRTTDETTGLTRSYTTASNSHDDHGADVGSFLATVPVSISADVPLASTTAGAVPPAIAAADETVTHVNGLRAKSKKGRFNVTKSMNGDRDTGGDGDGDAAARSSTCLAESFPSPPPLSRVTTPAPPPDAPLDDAMAPAPLTADDAAVAAATTTPASSVALAKKASRFNVVEEKGDWPRRHNRSAAAGGDNGDGAATPAASVAGMRLPPPTDAMAIVNKKLNELISASNAQQEAMRMLMSAIGESSRGKDKILTDLGKSPLIAVHLMGSEQSSNALVEENARLLAEVEEYKRKHKTLSEKVFLVLHNNAACLITGLSVQRDVRLPRFCVIPVFLSSSIRRHVPHRRPVSFACCRARRCSARRSSTRPR